MSNKKDKSGESRLDAVKAQFKRVIWPTKGDVAKESAVVLVVSVILGFVISLLDRGLLSVVDALISL